MTTTRKTTISTSQSLPGQFRGDMLALGLFQDTQTLPRELADLDKSLDHAIRKVLKLGDFKGKAQETLLLYLTGKTGFNRLLLVGLGKRNKLDWNTLRQAAGTATRQAIKSSSARLGLALHLALPAKFDLERVGQVITEGAITGSYNYDEYLPANNNQSKKANLRVVILEPAADGAKRINKGRKTGIILAQAQNRARAIDNKPGNEINPVTLARQSRQIARRFNLKCKIFDDRQLTEMGMNGILAVGGGSENKPRLIMLEHKPRGRTAAGKGPDVVLVGKAITFDSGGISLKPSAKMEAMKFDKSGGCNVLGIMTAVSELNLPLHVVGLVPTAENLPSHTSYRPGDIIRTYSGKTVEILNTDAEGRMILCDALAWAVKMKPGAIVDMATLTGSCVVALGNEKAGLFSNNEQLRKALEKASHLSGDTVWHLPCGDEYLEEMKSKIADLKNVGSRYGGACTAAAFLGAFISNDIPWAHIDIAGVADTDKEKPWRGVGATGFAVKLILEYLRGLCNKT